MRVLITGGAGFIGSHCVERFVAEGAEVTVLDNLDPQVHRGDAAECPRNILHHVTAGKVRFLRGDVRNRADVRAALEEMEMVIHLAAAVGVGQSMYTPHYYMDVNAAGQAMLLEEMVAKPRPWRRLIVASSMSIYGEGQYRCSKDGLIEVGERHDEQLEAGQFEQYCPKCGGKLQSAPTPETKGMASTSVYAISKKVQEESALCIGRAYRIPTTAFRFFNVYGPRQSLSNPYTGVLAIFASRMINGKPPLIFEDGGQTRDFIHVEDVTEAVWRSCAGETSPSGVYNICTGEATSVLDAAKLLAEELGVQTEAEIVGKFRSGDIRHCIGDPSNAAQALGFRARYSFRDGIKQLVRWAAAQKSEDSVDASLAELTQRGLVR